MISYTSHQIHQTQCSIQSKSTPPTFVYQFEPGEDTKQKISSLILNYLNLADTTGLQSAIEANSNHDAMYPDNQPQIHAKIVEQDITGDSEQDVLVDV